MSYQFSPETQRLYDEMLNVLRASLANGDADDAIGCLDALLSEHWEDVITEAAEAVAAYTGNPIDANAQMLRRLASRTTQES